MKKYLVPVFILFISLFTLSAVNAQEDVTVRRVKFNSLRNDWIQMEIELSCEGNSSETARNKRYVENIKVKTYLAYSSRTSEGDHDYYTSELEVVIMEKGDKNNVYFYLPGLIAERDSLRKEPDYYYVEVSVDGEAQKPQKNAMSSNIPNLEILNSFVSKADSEGAENEHLLMPIYLVSNIDMGRVDKLPAFLRRDVRD